MQQALASFWHATLDLLFPPRCLICAAGVEADGALCTECWRHMTFIGPPVCVVCGHPFSFPVAAGTQCGHCIRELPSFDAARSVFAYDEHSKRLVLGLKYADKTHLVPALGGWLVRAGEELAVQSDMVVPVPLHPIRMMRRRFNQSALLARAVARSCNLPLIEALRRTRHTPTQAGLSRQERRANVEHAFATRPRHAGTLKGMRIALVDDVMTTGATIEACTRELKRSGARSVYALTLARAVLD